MRLFYATTNPGKLFEVGKFLKLYGLETVASINQPVSIRRSRKETSHSFATSTPWVPAKTGLKPFGVELVGPKDLGLSIDVPEEGETLEENSIAKVQAYIDAGVRHLVIADDTGIEIDALGGEPGIYAGRWRDKKTRMTDEEIIAYCLMKMKGIPSSRRTAKFRTVIALGIPNRLKRTVLGVRQGQSLRDIELFDGVLRGVILEKPAPLRIEGFPFESLFYIPEWKMVLGDVHQLPAERKRHLLTHRERAVKKAITKLKKILGTR